MNGAKMVDTRGLFVSFRNLGTQLAARTTFTLRASGVSQQTSFISLRRSQKIYVQQSIALASVSSFLSVLSGTWTGINIPSLSKHVLLVSSFVYVFQYYRDDSGVFHF